MANSTDRISWRRLLIEGGVIVFSILLAFTIDAWWGERNEAKAQHERLRRVVIELEANAERVEQKVATLGVAINATSKYLSWMGPDPEEQDPEVFHDQWATIMSIGTFSLVRGAADEYIAAGRSGKSGKAVIRESVADWYLRGDNLLGQYESLRVAHENIADYTSRIPEAPALANTSRYPEMQWHPDSSFPYDQSALLADPVVESLLAIYLLRMEFIVAQATRQQKWHGELIALIASAD